MKRMICCVLLMACDSPGDDTSADATITATSDTRDGDVVVPCPDGFTGPDCESCLPGHLMGPSGCEPVVVDCVDAPDMCGAFGSCQFVFAPEPEPGEPREPDISVCVCDPGHVGTFCEDCDVGHQKNGMLGVCQPSCDIANLGCVSPRLCDDTSGVAQCVCPEGTTGASCELCALGFVAAGEECVRGDVPAPTVSCESIDALGGCGHGACHGAACICEPGWTGPRCGACAPGHEGDDCQACKSDWMRLGDGPCRPACHPNADSCGPNGLCWDQERLVAECQCEAGYTGPLCTDCLAGFSRVGQECLADFGPNERFFTLATYSDDVHLAVIDVVTGSVRAIRTLGVQSWNTSIKITWDASRGRLYMRGGAPGLVAVDPRSGVTTTIVEALPTSYQPVLAYDPTRDHVIVMEDRTLVAYDPETAVKTTLANIQELGSVNELTVDAANDRLLVGHFGPGQQGYFITAIALDDFVATELGEFPDFGLYTTNEMGIGVDSDGALIVASVKATSYAERRPVECRQEAFRLTGDAAYLTAPIRYLDPEVTPVVTSTQTSGPELVAVGDFFDENTTIDIATTNPDLVICPPWYFFENVTLRLAATARFRALGTPTAAFTLVVESGFPTDAPRVHVPYVEGGTVDPSLVDNPVVRLYTEAEWESRRIGSSGSSLQSWETNALRMGGWARGAVDMSAPFVVHYVDGMDLMGLAGPR